MEPAIKLVPTMKLKGKFTVSFIKRLTLILLELFWMPIISIANREEFKNILKITFFIDTKI